MTKWVYQARVVPMGKTMLLPDSHGRPTMFTFDEVNFSQSRRNVGAGDVPILLDHDPTLEVGKLRSLNPNREWWICSFELREDVIREPFEVGQPVSVGLGWTDGYVSSPWVGEVSIVRHGRVPGAEITHRMPMPVPAPAPAAVPGTVTKRPEPAGEVIYGGGLIRRNIGQVTAVGGRALRTPQGHPIRYVDDDIVIDLPDGRQEIYCGREGHAEAIRNGALTR